MKSWIFALIIICVVIGITIAFSTVRAPSSPTIPASITFESEPIGIFIPISNIDGNPETRYAIQNRELKMILQNLAKKGYTIQDTGSRSNALYIKDSKWAIVDTVRIFGVEDKEFQSDFLKKASRIYQSGN